MAWDRLIRGGTLVTGGGLSQGDLAIALGAFAREGLDIRTRTAGGGTGLLRTVPPELKR